LPKTDIRLAAAAAASPTPLFGLVSLYVDDVLVADSGITGSSKLKDQSITPAKIDKTTVVAELPIYLGQSPRGLASDSTGVKHETANLLIPTWVSSFFSAAYWEVGLLQLTDGTVALELYDATSAAVATAISLTATTYRTRSTNNILSGIAGKEVRGRLNVTSNGAAGSLAGDAFYRIVFVR
jgi:hypothetical protein